MEIIHTNLSALVRQMRPGMIRNSVWMDKVDSASNVRGARIRTSIGAIKDTNVTMCVIRILAEIVKCPNDLILILFFLNTTIQMRVKRTCVRALVFEFVSMCRSMACPRKSENARLIL